MSQYKLPIGHHDSMSAAKELNIGVKHLYKIMRNAGWLTEYNRFKNQPRHDALRDGLLKSIPQHFRQKGGYQIQKAKPKLVITPRGLTELQNMLKNEPQTPTPQPAATQPTPPQAQQPAEEKPYDRKAAEAERDKHLKQLEEWGFDLKAG